MADGAGFTGGMTKSFVGDVTGVDGAVAGTVGVGAAFVGVAYSTLPWFVVAPFNTEPER